MIDVGFDGLDPVAFLAHFQKSMGKPRYRTRHKGLTYFFVSEENLQSFLRTPDTYLPQLDGRCPFAYAALGWETAGSTKYTAVVGEKVYAFANPIFAKLCQLCPSLIERAESRYDRISARPIPGQIPSLAH